MLLRNSQVEMYIESGEAYRLTAEISEQVFIDQVEAKDWGSSQNMLVSALLLVFPCTWNML